MDDEDRGPTREFSEAECWAQLTSAPLGRIATTAAGEIDIFPVNHKVDGSRIVFRTTAGTKLLELTIRETVAFEVDGIDGDHAFSVVAKGRAEELQTSAEIERAEAVGVRPWAPDEKDRWVSIAVTSVSGRTFQLPADQLKSSNGE